jgi:hypothetical protein
MHILSNDRMIKMKATKMTVAYFKVLPHLIKRDEEKQ